MLPQILINFFLKNKFLVLVVILTLTIFGLFQYNKHLHNLLDKTKDKLKTQQQITKIVEKAKEITEHIFKLEENNQKNLDNLNKKFDNLEKVAKEKPKAVEKLVNQASKERNRCFELSTGAKPLKNEKNKQCPHLLKSE